MKKADIKRMMNHLLKKDVDYCNDRYTEWEYKCNQYKAISYDEIGNVKKMRKKTYHEICKETIEDALEKMPADIKKRSPEDIEEFLFSGWFSDLFRQHNNSNKR